MDEPTRLALSANGDTATLRKGSVVHVNSIPYELLDDVEAYSATTAHVSSISAPAPVRAQPKTAPSVEPAELLHTAICNALHFMTQGLQLQANQTLRDALVKYADAKERGIEL